MKFSRRTYLAVLLALALATPAALALPAQDRDDITPPTAEMSSAKQLTVDWVNEHVNDLIRMNAALWQFAEPGMLEYRSAEFMTDALEAAGFEVEHGVAGMPTAFVASYGSGRPRIGILAEYDALLELLSPFDIEIDGVGDSAAPNELRSKPDITGAAATSYNCKPHSPSPLHHSNPSRMISITPSRSKVSAR